MIDKGDDIPADPEVPGDFSEKREEERYPIPAVYQRYITLKVKANDDFVTVAMGNFSRHGILFESPIPFHADSHRECIMAIPELLSQDISFGIHVKYCFSKENSYVIGAAIESVADKIWFDIFVAIHDFIVQRRGVVY